MDRVEPSAERLEPCGSEVGCSDPTGYFFCGAGYCRDASAEQVTICLEEAMLVGAPAVGDGTPPNLQTTLFVVDESTGLSFTIAGETRFDTCHATWDRCLRVPATVVFGGSAWAVVAEEDASTGEAVAVSTNGFATLNRVDLDRGCYPLHANAYLGPDAAEVTVWMSVWYP